MNVGQIFESLLGFCGKNLKEKYNILPFKKKNKSKLIEKIIYNKLYETSKITKKKWIFNPNHIGKSKIFNGKTGKIYEQTIHIGYIYTLKLMHMAAEKITTRTRGNYSIVTKQPLKGKARKGGQRVGEMEIWAIEGFGSSYILQEITTIKSDDITNRYKTLNAIIRKNLIPKPNIPESFKVLVLELKSICFNISLFLND